MTHERIRSTAGKFALFALPVALALLLARLAPEPVPTAVPGLRDIETARSAELKELFTRLGYFWPPREPEPGLVPPVAVRAIPADIAELPVAERKTIFFRILAPLIAAENRRLREQRDFLERTFTEFPELPESGAVASRVRAIASRFNVGGDLDDPEVRRLLLRRVDTVPGALVLAQAANESGWGTSRFTREANNLFGMWTWDPAAGIAPRQRSENARHFVRVFEDLRASVANYLHTINVGAAYGELRELREAQRRRGVPPDALALAAGLRRYSARGETYVEEIRAIIRYNGLDELAPLRLMDELPERG